MKLVPIFVDGYNEGLYAVRYKENEQDAYERNFDKWDDTHFVMSYFILNEEYLKNDYFTHYTIDDLVTKVHDESDKLKDDFENAGAKIQDHFKPLLSAQKKFPEKDELQLAKSLVNDGENYPQPILRVYGLRLSERTFVITGGVIKLSHFMKDHHDTRDELYRLDQVRKWLIENGITTQDDLNYCYGE